jgi:hypothetical protein
MPGSVGMALWILGTVLEILAVVCIYRREAIRRYFFLCFYMLVSVVASAGRFHILQHYGLSSLEYRYFYFYSDALLTIALYFAVISLFSHVFEEMGIERYLRFAAGLLLAGTALFSYAIVSQSSARIPTHFAFELSQNLYFVGLALTYVLWGAIVKLRETRTQLIQIVLSLGIYFSVYAASYALSNLAPGLYSYTRYLLPAFSCLLPLSWAYAFWRLPVNARLAPARLLEAAQ